MSAIHTAIVEEAHAYTRSSVPWSLDTVREVRPASGRGGKCGWRLARYLSSGGMRAFGRGVRAEETDVKQARFLVAAAAFGALWLALLVF